jgi:hypothetical protein
MYKMREADRQKSHERFLLERFIGEAGFAADIVERAWFSRRVGRISWMICLLETTRRDDSAS